MIVTLDGPAGSGKSSTARAVADRLGFRHLDSGAFYRALTHAVLAAGIPPARWPELSLAELDELGVRGVPAEPGYRLLAGQADITDRLRSPQVNANVSAIAALPRVREWLLGRLRAAALGVDLVTDGRDMGTVVFPDADLKFFLVADPAVRARRRLLEVGSDPGAPGALEAEVARIQARDRADSERDVAPLRQPAAAILVDTTRLSFEEQVALIVAAVEAHREGAA